MSIATKTGDDGTTGLFFNRRVPKDHPRIEAYSTGDELNAAIGMAKALIVQASAKSAIGQLVPQLEEIQKELVVLMGEIATLPEDREKYVRSGHRFITDENVARLTKLVDEIESQTVSPKGWATPGVCPASAALHVARTTCRRAERRIFSLGEDVRKLNPHVIRYLNRLSDLLWLMARKIELRSETQ
jgi:cob(I)alamin adenosyltransferase